MTATEHLPLSQKNRFRHDFRILCPSNGIIVILIEFCVDWCLWQARETVRSKTNRKMWRRQNKNKTLTLLQKNGSRHEFSILRPSDSITVFLIQFRVDWCLWQAREMVRSHTKCKKWPRQNKNKHLPSWQKTDCDTSRQLCASPMVSLWSSLKSAPNDA